MKQARITPPQLARFAEVGRRKRLGQYFTGVGLGRLLAALAQAEVAKSIVDPMAGSGDLLASCLEISSAPNQLAGIEIDAKAHEACVARLPDAHCVLGSAFTPDAILQLPVRSWDLVIANPPYVRYQNLTENANLAPALPSAKQVRTGLLRTLDLLPALDDEDKRLFAHLVSGYSGLSDLAVPSWILCAALVKPGGRLALVAPEAWLSRDYATIVHYLLLRWFDVEFIVEDEHASWFNDAQVKTTLIIAKRVPRRVAALSQAEHSTYCHITISADAGNQVSPIGRIAPQIENAEVAFAKQAKNWLCTASSYATDLVRARPIPLLQVYGNVVAAASRQKWFASFSESEARPSDATHIPHAIHDWIAEHRLPYSFERFDMQGVAVGQGLRTGANSFFYANGKRRGAHIELRFSGPLAGLNAKAPLNIVKPVLRRQSELPDGFVVSIMTTRSWVLDLRGYVLDQDMGPEELVSSLYKHMPDEIANVINLAAKANFGTPENPKKVWELSAVSPNIRPGSRGAPARFWYMLPDFASRHSPDVLIARVNSTTPRAYLNEGRECVIDANFSTMWIENESHWTPTALLAFMNSTWVQAAIEHSGAVMGGGALKVEAAHLRRLPVPPLGNERIRKLSKLGEKLAIDDGIQKTLTVIDEIVAQALGCDEAATTQLKHIRHAGQARRAKHNGKRGESNGDELC